MSTRSIIAKGALAAVAGVMALSAAASAAAQPYGYYGAGANGGYYDPCRRDATGRSVVGALLGGGIGATMGSQLAARGHRTDGSVLGGVLGAMAGAAVGNSSAACTSGRVPYAPQSAYNDSYRAYPAPSYGYGYGERAYGYGSRYDDGYAYGRRGQRFRVVERPADADGCTLAESPIHMPDGRTQVRFVRVCMDSSGRYQVVD